MAAKKKSSKKKSSKKKTTSAKDPKAMKLQSLGVLIDRRGRLRAQRLKLSGMIEEIKKEESKLDKDLIGNLLKVDAEGATGREYQVSLGDMDIARVEDWELLYAWVFKHKIEDALQRRVSVKALIEHREDQGLEEIPGVVIEKTAKLNLSKRKRS